MDLGVKVVYEKKMLNQMRKFWEDFKNKKENHPFSCRLMADSSKTSDFVGQKWNQPFENSPPGTCKTFLLMINKPWLNSRERFRDKKQGYRKIRREVKHKFDLIYLEAPLDFYP